MGDKVEHVNTFIRLVKKLVSRLSEKFGNDAQVRAIKNKLTLASDMLPVNVVEITGKYLYKYRDQIVAEDEAFFVNNDFDDDLANADDPEDAELAALLIPKLRAAYYSSTKAEIADYIEIVGEMLDSYLEYRLL